MKLIYSLIMTLLMTCRLFAADYYWVGGSGNWSDVSTHWATSSGGSTFHTVVPSPADNVFFDGNSFTAPGQVVNLNLAVHECKAMSWTGVTNNPALSAPSIGSVNIYGSLTLAPNMTVGAVIAFFKSPAAGQTITTAGHFIEVMNFNGAGSWTMQDDVNVQSLAVLSGTVNTNNRTINCISINTMTPGLLNLGASVCNVTGNFQSTNGAINAGAATINISGFNPSFGGGGNVYKNLNQTGATGNIVINDAVFTGDVNLSGNGFLGNNCSFNNLSFAAGKNYFINGTQTITGNLQATGSCNAYINISSNPGSGVLSKTSGTVILSYVKLQHITATGGAVFTANDALDLGGNSGWTINQPAPRNLYWVGNGGNWSDGNHWSLSSGGPAIGCSPAFTDNVFFDGNSFTTPGQVVNLNLAVNECSSMSWTGVANNPSLHTSSPANINVYGSLTLAPNMTVGAVIAFFKSPAAGQTITTAGHFIEVMNFNGAGSWTMQDDVNMQSLAVLSGTVNTNNRTINCISVNTMTPGLLNLGASVCNVTGNFQSTSGAINAGAATINISGFNPSFGGGGNVYKNLNQTGATGNIVINDAVFTGDVNLSGNGFLGNNCSFNNLSFAAGKNYFINGTQTITGNLQATGSCNAYINISSNPGSGVLSKTSGTVTLSYVKLQHITATGGAVFTANNALDLGGNSGWTFNQPAPRNLYWVGNGGNWSDGNHWSLSSGGPAIGCSPVFTDNVFFDGNSFTAPGQVVNLNLAVNECSSMSWTGVTNNPSLHTASPANINVYGSLTLAPNMTVGAVIAFFKSPAAGQTITTAGHFIEVMNFNGAGSWTMQDDVNMQSLAVLSGTVHTNNRTINCISISAIAPGLLNLGTSVCNLTGNFQSDNGTVNAGAATINISGFNPSFGGGGNVYKNLNQTGTTGNIVITNAVFTGDVHLSGNAFLGNSCSFNNLTLAAGKLYTLGDNTTVTISPTGSLNAVGTGTAPIRIIGNNQSTIFKSAGSVCLDYVRMSNVHATGGAFFNAGLSPDRSFDLGGNTGWVFTGNNTIFYSDGDGDGYGSSSGTITACTPPAGYVTDSTDCNDANATAYPGAAELCNGIDDNCNGQVDEGVGGRFYRDADGDSFGNAAVYVQACAAPTGYVSDSTDCNDAHAAIYPGAAELCNGIDDDCDGQVDEGAAATVSAGADIQLYWGYPPAQCVTRTAVVQGPAGAYTYKWTLSRPLLSGESMTGANTATVTLCLKYNANLCIEITSAGNCTATDCAKIKVIDVRCGNGNKVQVCHKGNTICVSTNAVAAHLAHGDYLGECKDDDDCDDNRQAVPVSTATEGPATNAMKLWPNPSNGRFTVQLPVGHRFSSAALVNAAGQTEQQLAVNGKSSLVFNVEKAGVYFVRLAAAAETAIVRVVVIK